MKNLDDIKIIEKIDLARMRNVLENLPKHCEEAFQLGKDFSVPQDSHNIKNIVFSGMGGSAIGAEVISHYLRREIKVAIYLNRDYLLPEFVDQETLVILVSYSGNTEETLSAYNQAQSRKAKIIVLSSGGQLVDLAKRQGHPYLIIPSGLPPRGALAFLSLPVLAIFSQMHLIEDKEKQLKETVSVLEKLYRDCLGPDVQKETNLAKKIALRLFGNFCVLYAAGEHSCGVVTRWRGQLAENSKTLSSSHLLPEMNHNEIVGWQYPQKLLTRFVVVILRDQADHPQVKKRIEISKEILSKVGVQIEQVYSKGDSLLARIFSLIYVGDFVSFYLAILNGIDPTPVERIDYLKRRLKECK